MNEDDTFDALRRIPFEMIDPLDLGLITTEGDGIYLSSACDEFNNSKPFWNVLYKTGWTPDEYLKELKKRTGNDRQV